MAIIGMDAARAGRRDVVSVSRAGQAREKFRAGSSGALAGAIGVLAETGGRGRPPLQGGSGQRAYGVDMASGRAKTGGGSRRVCLRAYATEQEQELVLRFAPTDFGLAGGREFAVLEDLPDGREVGAGAARVAGSKAHRGGVRLASLLLAAITVAALYRPFSVNLDEMSGILSGSGSGVEIVAQLAPGAAGPDLGIESGSDSGSDMLASYVDTSAGSGGRGRPPLQRGGLFGGIGGGADIDTWLPQSVPFQLRLVMGEANPSFDMGMLRSSSALLSNFDTGNVLLKKDEMARAYPASLTKLMTVLVAIENWAAVPETIRLDSSIFPPLYRANSTMAGFLPDEEARAADLLYGAMLRSGGECCVALANAVAGSEEGFVALMNARALELGMKDTHFTNVTGLHDNEHFTTVRDLGILMMFALKNEAFMNVFTTKEHITAPTNMREEGIRLKGGVLGRESGLDFEGGSIIGGKTGYTEEAGQCLAVLGIKGNYRLVFISTGNGVAPPGFSYNFADALYAFEKGTI